MIIMNRILRSDALKNQFSKILISVMLLFIEHLAKINPSLINSYFVSLRRTAENRARGFQNFGPFNI